MDLYLLAELKTISLKVTTVDMLKPPPDFRSNFDSTPPPILIDGKEAVLENEKIERYIMKNIPGGHNLFVQHKDTATVIENLYSKFKLMLTRRDEQSRKSLLNQLSNIDAHLRKGRPLSRGRPCAASTVSSCRACSTSAWLASTLRTSRSRARCQPSGATWAICTSWRHSSSRVRPTRTSSTTTSCNRTPR
uniref:Putative chloride channel ixodes scapularis chloride channel n=1 Tax=Amblyomma triste TaxID=251400 RepID=A0A023GA12_AMBTT